MSKFLEIMDHQALKFGNGTTIVLLLIAFILNSPLIVLLVALSQLASALRWQYAPYRLAYQLAVRQDLLKPRLASDHFQPHAFAMLVGAVFNGIGFTVLLGSGIGWVPVWIVIALANLNFWLNFCTGCWMYYQFNRLGVPGFTVSKAV